jgi:hypothetical protein
VFDDLVDDGIGAAAIAIEVDDDAEAVLGETERGRTADAARCSGDDGCSGHGVTPWRLFPEYVNCLYT